METKIFGGQVEQRERPDYKITIVVHRHGEKSALAGSLSERGKDETAEFFSNAYKAVPLDLDDDQGVDIEHSPIDRTQETALLNANYSGVKINSIKSEERLSEGKIAHHKELLEAWGGLGGRWIPQWMALQERPMPDVKIGQEVVADFTRWLLEKIYNKQKNGGTQEIDAFSHYPVMVAFLLKLEQSLGVDLLPKNWQKEPDSTKIVNYLESFNFFTDSKDDNKIYFSYRGQKVTIPLDVLETIAKQ